MWRRVASQSPRLSSGTSDGYVKAFSALGQMLRDGRSLSGHERNCCFLNTRDDRFATVSAASGLDFADDGRAIGLADWDHDGDVDIWLANRTGPRLRFMRNNQPRSGGFVTFKLRGTTCNRDAVGARLELHLGPRSRSDAATGMKQIRTVRAGRGFMSQASKRIHFGIGASSIDKLVVSWPDGQVEEFAGIRSGCHFEIEQGRGEVTEWRRPVSAVFKSSTSVQRTPVLGHSRVVVVGRLPMPAIAQSPIQSDVKYDAARPTLVNLWSTSCLPCIEELSEFSSREADLRRAGINILALNVDELVDDPTSTLARSKSILQRIGFPFSAAAVDAEQSGMLDIFHQAFLSLRRPLPIPSSMLTTADGRVAILYRGPLDVDQLKRDIALLDENPRQLRDHAVPLEGRWLATPFRSDPQRHATAWMRSGFADQGARYLESYLHAHLNGQGSGPKDAWPSTNRLAELCETLADFYRLQSEPKKVIAAYQVALKFDPEFVPAFVNLGKILVGQGKMRPGLVLLERAHRLAPADPIVASDLAIAYAMSGRTEEAEAIFRRLLAQDVDTSPVRLHLGRLYVQARRYTDAKAMFEEHLKHDPRSFEAMRSLCWILVSSPNEQDRDLSQARANHRQLGNWSQRDEAALLDLQAAIEAELKAWDEATESVRQAIQLTEKQGNSTLASDMRQRLDLYQSRRVYRLP